MANELYLLTLIKRLHFNKLKTPLFALKYVKDCPRFNVKRRAHKPCVFVFYRHVFTPPRPLLATMKSFSVKSPRFASRSRTKVSLSLSLASSVSLWCFVSVSFTLLLAGIKNSCAVVHLHSPFLLQEQTVFLPSPFFSRNFEVIKLCYERFSSILENCYVSDHLKKVLKTL